MPDVLNSSRSEPLTASELLELVARETDGSAGGSPDEFWPTPERIQQEIGRMLQRPLSADLSRWVEGYARVGRRNPYLWGWCRQAVEVTTLPCVDPALRDHVCDTKTMGVMWDVMLDDVADQRGQNDLMEELLCQTIGRQEPDFSRFSPRERDYACFTADLWRDIMNRARTYPRHGEFAELLRYDYLQLANVMRYSHLLNGHLELLNLAEHDLYTPHNMHIMVCSTLDLMCSPRFDRAEIGILREIVWNTQCMGRIGNLVTTWQRELGERDFTSGVYARAVSTGDLTVADLERGDRNLIEPAIIAGRHEEYFLNRWQRHRKFLLSQRHRLKSFDVGQTVAAFERLVCLHLGSRGNK